MAIRAVVFDYGKVISFPPDDAVMDEIAARAGVERAILEPLVWGRRAEYDLGLVDGPEYYRRVLGSLDVAIDHARAAELSRIDRAGWTRVNPATVALMEELKASGCLVGILSNMPADFLAWARDNMPVFSLPDVGVFSCEAGAVKPEATIYRQCLSALGCGPEETVFFDDIPANVEGARALSIRAFLWENAAAARRELVRLGLRAAQGRRE